MKKFKRFFYPIYLAVIVIVLIMSFNIYGTLELLKNWGWFRYFSDLPYMGRDLLIFLCVLMIVEIVAENLQLASLKAKIKEFETRITDLKAKLYDKSQGEVIPPEEEMIDEAEWDNEEPE